MRKQFLSMSLALAMVVTAFTTPLVAGASTNNNTSVDKKNNSKVEVATTTVYTLPAMRNDMTLGVTGVYQLKLSKIGLTEVAKEYGFTVLDDKTLGYTSLVGDKLVDKKVSVEWNSSNSKYATINSVGKATAKKVCKINPDTGNYYTVALNATIPNVTYVNSEGQLVQFKGGIVATTNTTVVPEEDLAVYFLGVWEEDLKDSDAQHKDNFAVNSYNVEDKLKEMAESSTNHCVGNSYDVVAYTKTDDGSVRAYLVVDAGKAGSHYYTLTFKSASGDNRIDITHRDYCDTTYTKAGSLSRVSK